MIVPIRKTFAISASFESVLRSLFHISIEKKLIFFVFDNMNKQVQSTLGLTYWFRFILELFDLLTSLDIRICIFHFVLFHSIPTYLQPFQ